MPDDANESETKESDKEPSYHVKGYWSDEGFFNGAIYCNNHKFGACVRGASMIISVSPSIGKDAEYQRFKRYLIEKRLKRGQFLCEKIADYMLENPDKRIKLV